MRGKGQFVCFFLMFSFCSFIPQISQAWEFQRVNARSAILYDMNTGKVLYEQNADALIPPASLTKLITLYLTFEAIESGRISLSDRVRVSRRAASMPDVRMGLRAGDIVTVAQLIRGMAIESGNDAAVAMAEYLGGSVENFVAMMNAKARELGLTHTHFMTPNGLPARGQLTTARDILKLSAAYIRRFPGALSISCMRSYTYRGKTDMNPNNLLGVCPGVDGLKTGFVCASGFNISVTAVRDNIRMIAVVLGATNPWIRRTDVETMLEEGYREVGGPYYAVGHYQHVAAAETHELVAPAQRRCIVRNAPRAQIRPSRLAARSRARYAARRRVLKTTARYAARGRKSRARLSREMSRRTRARSFARPRRIAPGNLAARGKYATRHRRIFSRPVAKTRKLAKIVHRGKTVRATPTRVSARARIARYKGKASVRHLAGRGKYAASHRRILSRRIAKRRKLTKAVYRRKTSAKTRSARYRKLNSVVHRRARVKTAIDKKRRVVRHVALKTAE